MQHRVKIQTAFLAGIFCLLSLPAPAQTEERAQQIFDLTNQDRTANGLQPLRWDEALAKAAAAHAEHMRDAKTLSHQYPGEPDTSERAAQAGAKFQAIAENIAMGPDPKSIEKQWMNSVPHRTNILDPQMNAIGIAVIERGGYLYAVEDFANASESLTTDQVEAKVSDLLRNQNVDPSGDKKVAEAACRMSSGMPEGAGARAIARFQTASLNALPAQVAQQIKNGQFTKAAVGACPSDGSQGSFTVYRVAILLY